MRFIKMTAMLLTGALVLGIAAAAGAHGHYRGCRRGQDYACSAGGELQVRPELMRAPHMQILRGVIKEVSRDRVLVAGEDGRSAEVMLTDDTYIVEGVSGRLRRPSALRAGQEATAYYSSRMTRSLPPQAEGYALVLGSSEDYTARFLVADQVQKGDGCVKVLSSTQDLIVTIDGSACSSYGEIRPGDRLLVWSMMMTMSLPGLTNAERAVLLP